MNCLLAPEYCNVEAGLRKIGQNVKHSKNQGDQNDVLFRVNRVTDFRLRPGCDSLWGNFGLMTLTDGLIYDSGVTSDSYTR